MSLSNDLMKAIRSGNLRKVVAALDAGAPVELDDGKGDPGLPLAIACFMGHAEIVRELAPEMGADEVQLYYSIVTQAREQLHLAPDAQAGFTMMLLRLLAFAPEHFKADSAKK